MSNRYNYSFVGDGRCLVSSVFSISMYGIGHYPPTYFVMDSGAMGNIFLYSISLLPAPESSIMEHRPKNILSVPICSCGVKDHGLCSSIMGYAPTLEAPRFYWFIAMWGSGPQYNFSLGAYPSLCSQNCLLCGVVKDMNVYKTTVLLCCIGIGAMLTFAPQASVLASEKVKVAGWQFSPVLNGTSPEFFSVRSWSEGDVGGYTALWGGNDCCNVALGAGATLSSGVAGQLCLSIGEPGYYDLGIDDVIVGDCAAHRLYIPVDLPHWGIMVVQCADNDTDNDTGDDNDTEPPVDNETFGFSWINPPEVVCAGEKFCFNVGVTVPVATEYSTPMFFVCIHGGVVVC